jgi:UDP-2-acetamido-2,6-beta-L-arabino-hexul-4-ose reductase
MKVVITGAAGMQGWHLACRMSAVEPFKGRVTTLARAEFNDDAVLSAALIDADAVVHLAGINRASDEDLEQGNLALAARLTSFLEKSGGAPHVVYSNTLHKGADNPYGRGKSAAHNCLQAWANTVGANYSELVMPHVFGEHGRPFYNSGVHTFCHQLVAGEALSVNPDGKFELLHAGDVSKAICVALLGGKTGEQVLAGVTVSVPELANKLQGFYDLYSNDVIPDLRNPLDLQLFNVLRSYMFPSFYGKPLTLHSDDRGNLFEAVKNHNGGQTFLSTTKPGITRGNHFHFGKVERFLVVKGEAVIRLRRLGTEDVIEFTVSGSQPTYVDMPTLHTHSITNVGDGELLTMFWSHEIFDPENPDTYFEPVLAEGK